MAIVPTAAVQTDWQRITGKTLDWQSVLTSKMKIARVTITFPATGTYTTGGDVVDLSLNGRLSTVLAVIFLHSDEAYYAEYVEGAGNDATLGKILLKGYINDDAAGTNVDPEAFNELTSASVLPQNAILEAIVFGV